MKLGKLSWLVVIVIAIIPFAYFSLRLLGVSFAAFLPNPQDLTFLDGAMGNWFATMVGLIAGVPIGLWINQKQQQSQDQEKSASETKIKQERKSKILNLLRNELELNRQNLVLLIEKQAGQPRIVIPAAMKDTLWRSFSDSGELYWVDDPTLVDKISSAYHNITALIKLEYRYSDPYFKSSVSDSTGRNTYAGESTVKVVHSLRPNTLEKINEALNSIDLELHL